MPSYRHHDFGNLYVHFDVRFPSRLGGLNGESITADQIKMLEKVLPPRLPGVSPPSDAMTEDYLLEDVDMTREGSRAHGVTMEDEDDEMQGGERVQCASQ